MNFQPLESNTPSTAEPSSDWNKPSTKEPPPPTTAYDFFVRYQRKCLTCFVPNMVEVDKDALAKFSYVQWKEAYKNHVKRVINEDTGDYEDPSENFQRHVRHQWELAAEPRKDVFRELAREGLGSYSGTNTKYPPPPSQPFLAKEDVTKHCPVVHVPHADEASYHDSRYSPPFDTNGMINLSAKKRRKLSLVISNSSIQGIAEVKQGTNVDQRSIGAKSSMKPCSDTELHKFLSQLDWGRL